LDRTGNEEEAWVVAGEETGTTGIVVLAVTVMPVEEAVLQYVVQSYGLETTPVPRGIDMVE